MAEFSIELNDDNTVKRILRDGTQHDGSVSLEQLFSIVTMYFQLANANLNQMRAAEAAKDKRGFGVQAFLMSLTGLEAFANTYFHLRAQELEQPELVRRVEQNRSTLAQKFRDLITLVGHPEMQDQEALLTRIFQFSSLRNELMHARWTPSSLTLLTGGPIIIHGMVENMQAQFEEQAFCHEALFWCLLVVARIAQARGNSDVSGFMFYWTGNYGLTLHDLARNCSCRTRWCHAAASPPKRAEVTEQIERHCHAAVHGSSITDARPIDAYGCASVTGCT